MSVEIDKDGMIVNTELMKREMIAAAFAEVVDRKCPCTVPRLFGSKCAFGTAGCHACISNHASVGELPACCLPQIDLVTKRIWRSPWAWVVHLLQTFDGYDELPGELQQVIDEAVGHVDR